MTDFLAEATIIANEFLRKLTPTCRVVLQTSSGEHYTGEVDDKGRRSRRGVQRWPNGNCYIGQWKDGRMHGDGVFFYAAEGDQYHGEFVNDKKSGQGRYVYKNGNLYLGSFFEDRRHGKGRYVWTCGDSYDGDWSNGHMEGHGITVYSNGNRYEGEFVNNRKEGKGTLSYSDGFTYEGDWMRNMRHGKGKYFSLTGDCYEGEWMDDKKHGYGVDIFPNSNYFVGQWNVNHSTDVIKYANRKDIYSGGWSAGKMNGTGVYNFYNSFTYDGDMKDTVEGQMFTNPHQSVFNGVWQDGIRHAKGELRLSNDGKDVHKGKMHGECAIYESNINRSVFNGIWQNGTVVSGEFVLRSSFSDATNIIMPGYFVHNVVTDRSGIGVTFPRIARCTLLSITFLMHSLGILAPSVNISVGVKNSYSFSIDKSAEFLDSVIPPSIAPALRKGLDALTHQIKVLRSLCEGTRTEECNNSTVTSASLHRQHEEVAALEFKLEELRGLLDAPLPAVLDIDFHISAVIKSRRLISKEIMSVKETIAYVKESGVKMEKICKRLNIVTAEINKKKCIHLFTSSTEIKNTDEYSCFEEESLNSLQENKEHRFQLEYKQNHKTHHETITNLFSEEDNLSEGIVSLERQRDSLMSKIAVNEDKIFKREKKHRENIKSILKDLKEEVQTLQARKHDLDFILRENKKRETLNEVSSSKERCSIIQKQLSDIHKALNEFITEKEILQKESAELQKNRELIDTDEYLTHVGEYLGNYRSDVPKSITSSAVVGKLRRTSSSNRNCATKYSPTCCEYTKEEVLQKREKMILAPKVNNETTLDKPYVTLNRAKGPLTSKFSKTNMKCVVSDHQSSAAGSLVGAECEVFFQRWLKAKRDYQKLVEERHRLMEESENKYAIIPNDQPTSELCSIMSSIGDNWRHKYLVSQIEIKRSTIKELQPESEEVAELQRKVTLAQAAINRFSS